MAPALVRQAFHRNVSTSPRVDLERRSTHAVTLVRRSAWIDAPGATPVALEHPVFQGQGQHPVFQGRDGWGAD